MLKARDRKRTVTVKILYIERGLFYFIRGLIIVGEHSQPIISLTTKNTNTQKNNTQRKTAVFGLIIIN